MNPLAWQREHKVALALAIAIGAAAGVILGYILYAIGSSPDGALTFHDWVRWRTDFHGFWWALFGGAIGAALIYIRQLLQPPFRRE